VEGLLLRPRAGVTGAAPWPRAEALTTQRLVLEPLRPDHARALAPPDGAQGWLNWVARDGATHAPVGTVQATITEDDGMRTGALAWVVTTSRQGEGLATEAAGAARDWLRDHGVTRFVAHIDPDHGASAAVARRLGLAATDERHDGEVRWVGS
jgi:RimJ/RimL family protein N-acetyltransferase